MEIDPVDDGPKQDTPMNTVRLDTNTRPSQLSHATAITQEEEARQAIEMLRGDDVAERVSAASRLEAVAAALGEERTREVSALLRSESVHNLFAASCALFFNHNVRAGTTSFFDGWY